MKNSIKLDIKCGEALEFEGRTQQEQQKKTLRQMVASQKKTISKTGDQTSLELGKGLFINTVLIRQQNIPTERVPSIYYTFGRDFKQNFDLMRCFQIYPGEKPHIYNECEKYLSNKCRF